MSFICYIKRSKVSNRVRVCFHRIQWDHNCSESFCSTFMVQHFNVIFGIVWKSEFYYLKYHQGYPKYEYMAFFANFWTSRSVTIGHHNKCYSNVSRVFPENWMPSGVILISLVVFPLEFYYQNLSGSKMSMN